MEKEGDLNDPTRVIYRQSRETWKEHGSYKIYRDDKVTRGQLLRSRAYRSPRYERTTATMNEKCSFDRAPFTLPSRTSTSATLRGPKPDVLLTAREEVTELHRARAQTARDRAPPFRGTKENSPTQIYRAGQIDAQAYLAKRLHRFAEKAARHLTFELCHRHSQECPRFALARG